MFYVEDYTMICPKCSTELSDKTNFCPNCGFNIEKQNEPAANDTQRTVYTLPTDYGQAKPPEPNFFVKFWNKMSLFSKITAIAIVIAVVFLLVAIFTKNVFAIIFSALQLLGFIVSILMNKGIIKLEKTWIKYIVLIGSILFFVLNVMSYSWIKAINNKTPNTNYPSTSNPVVSDTSSEPAVTTANIPLGSAECLDMDYLSVMADLEDAGFSNVKAEAVEDLQSTEADKVGKTVSVSVNGSTDFEKGQEFNLNDEIIIRYHAYKKYTVKLKIDFPGNLFFNTYDVILRVDGVNNGTMSHGAGKEYELALEPTEHTFTFENSSDSKVKGEVKLMVNGDLDASYKITCYSDRVNVELVYVNRSEGLSGYEVKVNASDSDYKGRNYEEVISELQKLGFTNIETEQYTTTGSNYTDGEVYSVTINDKSFKAGEVFYPNVKVLVKYYVKEAPKPTYYSTNDYETAKKGNTGVFAYKERRKYNDYYWIIDFDEGYVYDFIEGDGNTEGTKGKIDSGDLNSRVKIIYNDDGREYVWYCHFHYVNSPSTLIVTDHYGFDTKYSTADLDTALRLRDTKSIIDLS